MDDLVEKCRICERLGRIWKRVTLGFPKNSGVVKKLAPFPRMHSSCVVLLHFYPSWNTSSILEVSSKHSWMFFVINISLSPPYSHYTWISITMFHSIYLSSARLETSWGRDWVWLIAIDSGLMISYLTLTVILIVKSWKPSERILYSNCIYGKF